MPRAPNGSSPPQSAWEVAVSTSVRSQAWPTARAAEGDRRGARRLLLTAEAPAATTGIYTVHAVVWVAEAWGALGERDPAIALLRRFVEPRDLHFQLHLRHDPGMQPLRADPRFTALVQARP